MLSDSKVIEREFNPLQEIDDNYKKLYSLWINILHLILTVLNGSICLSSYKIINDFE